MAISGKYFPSQVSGERVFLLIRRHWIIFAAMIFFVVVLFVPVFILIIYWIGNSDVFSGYIGNFAIILGGIYSLITLGLLMYGFVNYYLDVYIVTNKRIVDIQQKGFFRREIAELHLHQVQDVEAQVDGFLQTIMHFGNIHIQTAGERENFIFEDVPHPYTLAKEIVELHEASIETEYEPQVHHDEKASDDYRPEDYFQSDEEKTSESSPEPEHLPAEPEVNEKQPINDEESEGGIKYLEESFDPQVGKKVLQNQDQLENNAVLENQKPINEYGFGTDGSSSQKKFEQELKEMSEGKEVSLDDRDREV